MPHSALPSRATGVAVTVGKTMKSATDSSIGLALLNNVAEQDEDL